MWKQSLGFEAKINNSMYEYNYMMINEWQTHMHKQYNILHILVYMVYQDV